MSCIAWLSYTRILQRYYNHIYLKYLVYRNRHVRNKNYQGQKSKNISKIKTDLTIAMEINKKANKDSIIDEKKSFKPTWDESV